MKALGGYRKKILDESPNVALRNQSFRNYADYMLTPEFESAIAGVDRACAEQSPTATCAPSGFTSAATACWFRIGWSRTDTKCCTLTATARRNRTNSWPKRASRRPLIYRGDRLL